VVDPTANPLNARVVARLRAFNPEAPAVAAPADHSDPYLQAGSHPDVVERVWDGLGARLPPGARALVFGAVALIHPTRGAVLALAGGTMYFLRLTAADLAAASRTSIRGGARPADADRGGLGARQAVRLGDGSVYDVAAEYGPDWVLGEWDEREAEWLANSFRAHGDVAWWTRHRDGR
jgi:hypothetical protein